VKAGVLSRPILSIDAVLAIKPMFLDWERCYYSHSVTWAVRFQFIVGGIRHGFVHIARYP